jgi:hypothetical protein
MRSTGQRWKIYIKGERIGDFAKPVVKVDNEEGRMPWDAVL